MTTNLLICKKASDVKSTSPERKKNRLKHTKTIALILTLVVTGIVQADSSIQQRIQQIESGLLPEVVVAGRPKPAMSIRERMDFYGVPGVSIAVINNHTIKWAKAYGLSNVNRADNVTPQTLFQAASISKPITAMAALWLVQKGKLALDDDINQSLQTWKLPENEHTQDHKVTLRRLLTHSAGINNHGFRGYATDDKIPSLIQILKGDPPTNSIPIRVESIPGQESHYSGGGYLIVQKLLEDIAHKRFPEFMKQAIFQRLDMQHSTFEQPPESQFTGSLASGHLSRGNSVTSVSHIYPEMAAAGLWSTPSDLALFVVDIQNAINGEQGTILTKEMAERMVTSQADDWSFGFNVANGNGANWFSHIGQNVGFSCYLFAYTKTGQGAVVMLNSDNGEALAFEIFRSISHAYEWPDWRPEEITVADVDPAVFENYVGRYSIADIPDSLIVVESHNNRLSREK